MSRSGRFSSRVISNFSELQQLVPEWNRLLESCNRSTPFQYPEWLLAWIQAFTPPELHVIEVRSDGELVGLAPLFLYDSGKEKTLAPVGASVSDYIDWLIEPAHADGILKQIFDELFQSPRHWDRLDLTDIPSSSPLLEFGFDDWDCVRSVETACPVLSLPTDSDSLDSILPAKLRHNLRTAQRRIERAGEARVEIADAVTLDEFLEALMRLHGARWTQFGVPGVLADNAVQKFHQIAARGLLARNALRLYGLRFNGRLIATLYALTNREVVYCYLQGFDPEYGTFSPGAKILAAVIQDAIRDGKTAVDFLRGREPYKYAWGAKDQQTYRLCIRKTVRVRQSSSPALAA